MAESRCQASRSQPLSLSGATNDLTNGRTSRHQHKFRRTRHRSCQCCQREHNLRLIASRTQLAVITCFLVGMTCSTLLLDPKDSRYCFKIQANQTVGTFWEVWERSLAGWLACCISLNLARPALNVTPRADKPASALCATLTVSLLHSCTDPLSHQQSCLLAEYRTIL